MELVKEQVTKRKIIEVIKALKPGDYRMTKNGTWGVKIEEVQGDDKPNVIKEITLDGEFWSNHPDQIKDAQKIMFDEYKALNESSELLPENDTQKIAFIDDLKDLIIASVLPGDSRVLLNDTHNLLQVEMFTRKNLEHMFTARTMVRDGYLASIPPVNIEDFSNEGDADHEKVKSVFEAFTKSNAQITEMMTLTTEHFTKVCKLIVKIVDLNNIEMCKDMTDDERTEGIKETLALIVNLHLDAIK